MAWPFGLGGGVGAEPFANQSLLAGCLEAVSGDSSTAVTEYSSVLGRVQLVVEVR
jgi:hypothetical protein